MIDSISFFRFELKTWLVHVLAFACLDVYVSTSAAFPLWLSLTAENAYTKTQTIYWHLFSTKSI